MPYSHSSPIGGCSADQSTLRSPSVNRNWSEGSQPAFRGNAVSVANQSVANNTNAGVQYSRANSYQQSSPVYDPRSPYSYTRPFTHLPSETAFSNSSIPLAHSFSKTTAGLSGIQTDILFKREQEFSPRNLSPSSATSQFYGTHQHFSGSTPSLVSSNSTPPTGKSKHILLTPDPNFESGNLLPLSPNHYNSTKTNSPMLYNGSTGATPALTALNIEDSGLDVTTPTDGSAPLRRPSSSVLLGSNFNSQYSHRDLDPLEIESDLTAIDAPASNATGLDDDYGDIGINIVSADPYPHNIPVTVALDGQGWPTPLSPLMPFQAIQMAHDAALHNMYGVAIGPPGWTSNVPPSASSPTINVTSSPHDKRSESLTPSSSQNVLASDDLYRRPNNQSYGVADPQDVLEAVRNGEPHKIINPKGVSDRTLAAAQANRKREAKFRCDVCGNSQTSKQNLDNHVMSRHLQLKRFVCPVPGCSAKYGHARGVNRHLDSKHPGHRLKGKRGPSKRTTT